MAFGRTKSPEELAADAARKQAEVAQREADAFWRSVPGQARAAYQRGDSVFQFSMDVMNQQAVIVAMIGSTTTQRAFDPNEVLNAVAREGWALLTGSFVFIELGQQSRDKFMASGQNVATRGETVGYYLFRRAS